MSGSKGAPEALSFFTIRVIEYVVYRRTGQRLVSRYLEKNFELGAVSAINWVDVSYVEIVCAFTSIAFNWVLTFFICRDCVLKNIFISTNLSHLPSILQFSALPS